MEKELTISFPGSSIGDSAFYNEYSNEEFVQEFTLIELIGAGIIAASLASLGNEIFKTCAASI